MHLLAQGIIVGLIGAVAGALAAPGPVRSPGSASAPPMVLCHTPEAVAYLVSGSRREDAYHALMRVNAAFGGGTCEVHSSAFVNDQQVGRTVTAWGVMSIMQVKVSDPSRDAAGRELFGAVLEPTTDI